MSTGASEEKSVNTTSGMIIAVGRETSQSPCPLTKGMESLSQTKTHASVENFYDKSSNVADFEK